MTKATLNNLNIDINQANEQLASLSPIEIIQWSCQVFGDQLYALTSAGADSALLLEHIKRSHEKIPVIHIFTGFLPKETVAFLKDLKQHYDFKLYQFGPTNEQVKNIKYLRLWEGDLKTYSQITKLDPLSRAIKKLKVKALLTGVRSDQTDNRATLGYIGIGNDKELRIRPFINWSKDEVDYFIDSNKLMRNPLYQKGFESIGDIHNTRPGEGRSGRDVMECGIHVVGGRVISDRV